MFYMRWVTEAHSLLTMINDSTTRLSMSAVGYHVSYSF